MLNIPDILNTIILDDCYNVIKELPDNSINIIYTDPPYNMNSRYYIDSKGHYCFKGAGSDFMNKWDVWDGRQWDKYFKEAHRIVKHGGFVIMHNIDRQSDLWTYYARRNGFMPMQKLYWLFITNFPKAVDVAKAIDKKLGHKPTEGELECIISDLAKEYAGYKYGQAPLKQSLEEILIFWKPSLDTPVEDIISIDRALKSGLPTKLHCPIINLKDTMVKPTKNLNNLDKRHTPQLIVSSYVAPYVKSKVTSILDVDNINELLPKIPFTAEDMEAYYLYCPKANKAEKEAGLEEFETVMNNKAGLGTLLNEDGKDKWATESKNSHPTPKPLALAEWILKLFKPPHDIIVMDTFAGSGSIPLACARMGIDSIGVEMTEEYHKIAVARTQNREKTLFG